MKSSLGLCFPPQIAPDALFDTRKEAKVSTCVLLQDKRGKVGDIFQLARPMALVVWASSSKTRARIAKNLCCCLKQHEYKRHTILCLQRKKLLKGGSQHSIKFLKHFHDSVIFMTL